MCSFDNHNNGILLTYKGEKLELQRRLCSLAPAPAVFMTMTKSNQVTGCTELILCHGS